MSNPRPSAGRREPRPKRTAARIAFFLVFLALFGAVDIIAYRYETAARAEFQRAPANPQTWRMVAEQYPFSYIACRARARLRADAPDLAPRDEHAVAGHLQTASRRFVAPAVRWVDSLGGASLDLADAAARVEAAAFSPLRLSYMALAATLFTLLLATYQLFGFWRRLPPALSARFALWVGALGLTALQWIRCYGPVPSWLAPLIEWRWYFEAEFLVALAYGLLAFCLLFWQSKPPRKIVRDDDAHER